MKSSSDWPFGAFRSMRRTATVTMSVPERRWASAMTWLARILSCPDDQTRFERPAGNDEWIIATRTAADEMHDLQFVALSRL